MSGSQRFEIDFSEAKTIEGINSLLKSMPIPSTQLDTVWGFSAPANTNGNGASGACAIGTILHHHEIGWNHIARDRHGHPENDPFIAEIMRWSEAPNSFGGNMDTSPPHILNALRKAGLQANWFAGNNVESTLNLIFSELRQDRPVIVLTNHGQADSPLRLEWEVVYKVANDIIHSKRAAAQCMDETRSIAQFKTQITLALAPLSCSVITAWKD